MKTRNSKLETRNQTGLYVHIPFCIRKCHYCHFVTTPTGTSQKRASYFKALNLEAAHVRKTYDVSCFDTVYLGGGTPSALNVDEMSELFQILRKHFLWNEGCEMTCEVNPGEVDGAKARLYQELGVNRISLGAQTFQDHHLKRLNRIHASSDIRDTFRMFRDLGFQNINCDLMIGLPDQTLDELKIDLNEILALEPEHVSIYDLSIDAGTVFEKLYTTQKIQIPHEDVCADMELLVRKTLMGSGYEGYALSCYAKKGYASQHNLNYWVNGDYLGLGPSAFSYLEKKRFQRSNSYEGYLAKVFNNDWTCESMDALNELERESETFLLALRLREGAREQKTPNYCRVAAPEINDLITQGLLRRSQGHMCLTERGIPLAETIFARLVLGKNDHS